MPANIRCGSTISKCDCPLAEQIGHDAAAQNKDDRYADQHQPDETERHCGHNGACGSVGVTAVCWRRKNPAITCSAINTQPTGTQTWTQNIENCSATAWLGAVRMANSNPYHATTNRNVRIAS